MIGFLLDPNSAIEISFCFKDKTGFSLVINFGFWSFLWIYPSPSGYVGAKVERRRPERIKSSSVGSSCFVLTVSHMYCHPLLSVGRGVAEPHSFLVITAPLCKGRN